MQKSFIVVLITAVVVALFAVMNAEPVTINLIFAKYQLSQAVVILVSTVLGALSMFILNVIQTIKLKGQIKQLSKKLIDSDTKNADLALKVEELEASSKEKTVTKEALTPENFTFKMPEEDEEIATDLPKEE